MGSTKKVAKRLSTNHCHSPASSRRALALRSWLAAFGASGVLAVAASDPVPAPAPVTAPPPAFTEKLKSFTPLEGKVGGGNARGANFSPASVTQYFIGEPTPEEQLYLEMANRARMNPPAEALIWRNTTDPDVVSSYGYFGVNLATMVSQISAFSATQPLSFNAQLLAAARRHTADMFVNNFQGHIGSDGSNPGLRITGAGYAWNTYGENAFTAARSVTHGHAGFEVDWGGGPGGMQSPAGHRLNIHNGNFREAGIGVTNGLRGNVGPQVVTEEFASRNGLTPFITGVVFFDFDGDGFYDVGEGLGGVRVDVPGSDWFAITANSGGYSVPVSADGTYTVTFSGPNLPLTTRSVTVSGGLNAKLDWIPTYAPPVLSGPATVTVGRPNNYSFNAVGAASGYQWKQARRVSLTAVEGAENGLNNVTVSLSTNYSGIQSAVRASGNFAFQLVHPQPVDQTLTLNWSVRAGTNAQLAFSSRLGWATPSQIARVQATTNSGVSWIELWSRAGDNAAGQSAFARVTLPLSQFTGREIAVRFLYDHTGGSYYYQTGSGMGWYIDDIGFSDCEQLVSAQVADVAATSFSFVPSEPASYSLRVRARVGGGYLDWGPAALPSASTTTISVRISTPPAIANNRATFNFNVLTGTPATFTVEASPGPFGPWAQDVSAIITPIVAGSQYRANCATSPSGRCFYRVVAR
jgi:hypothetical protein